MAKTRSKKSNGPKNPQSSHSSSTAAQSTTNATNAKTMVLRSANEDFLDNIKETINKKRKHVKNFFSDSRHASGLFHFLQ